MIAGAVEQREAQVEQLRHRVVHAAHQHTLVADVAQSGLEHRPGRLGHQRRDRLGRVHVGVHRDHHATLPRDGGDPLDAGPDVVGQPVLRHPHQRLGGQPDVADVLDLQQVDQERLEPRPRHVRHVAAGHHDVADARRSSRGSRACRPAAVCGLATNFSLSITGVELPTRSIRVQCPQYCGQVGRISASTLVGYRWVNPSVAHISCSCSESRVACGCDGQSVRRSREHRQHVAADRVGVERLGVRPRRVRTRRHDRVQHLRRQQHRHRRPLGLVALQVRVEPVLEQVAHHVAQLLDVLHAVRALPLHRAPLRRP